DNTKLFPETFRRDVLTLRLRLQAEPDSLIDRLRLTVFVLHRQAVLIQSRNFAIDQLWSIHLSTRRGIRCRRPSRYALRFRARVGSRSGFARSAYKAYRCLKTST